MLLVALLSLIVQLEATAIAVTFDGRRAAVAADSKLIVVTRNGTQRERPICKIARLGPVVFTAAGILEFGEMNVYSLAAQAVRTTHNTEEAREAFIKLARPLLRLAFSAARRRHPSPPRLLEALFLAAEDGEIAVRGVYFSEMEGLPFSVVDSRRFGCPENCDRSTFLMLGSNEAAHEAFPSLLRRRSLSAIQIAERLVETELAADPVRVGGPIQLLEMGRQGPRWIRHTGLCQEDQLRP
ncbi:MAG: hypothetical protein NTY38_15780 [Acidobacteria bacterium]|nr:hypothetical protein [Acidobacteriota bacterium]